jgi:hypothetical protein
MPARRTSMINAQYKEFVEERVTVLTEGERIEGQLFHMGGTRLSDFLNSSAQQEFRFLKMKDPVVYCRRSGQELIAVPFLMVARDRIVMVLTHVPPEAEPEPDDPFARTTSRDPLGRSF